MTAAAERPDFEHALGQHAQVKGWPIVECRCGWCADHGQDYTAHRAHLAAALNAEVARWLADEGTRERVADAFSHTGVNRPQGFTVSEWRNELATAALATLAPIDTAADEKRAGR